jgi:hypothetical protein
MDTLNPFSLPIHQGLVLDLSASPSPTNLHHFLIYILSFSVLTPFDWFISIYSVFFLWEHHFCFMPFSFTPTFSGTQWGCKTKPSYT